MRCGAAQDYRGLRAGRDQPAGRRQCPIKETSCGVDQLAIRGGRDGVAQREHRPPVAVIGAEAPDPRSVDRAEIPEAAAGRVEGVGEEAKSSPGALLDRHPAQRSPVEQVYLECSGHVVDAVAVCWVGPRPDRVLHDSHAIGHRLEMLPADRMERRQVRHRRPPVAPGTASRSSPPPRVQRDRRTGHRRPTTPSDGYGRTPGYRWLRAGRDRQGAR